MVELLPWDPPEYEPVWKAAARSSHRELVLRYRLHTVPPGIPTWFIAREHRFTRDLHWRTGVLLEHPDRAHVALLTMDRLTKTVELRVRGPYPQDFFAVLKDGFEETLERYPGLGIDRLVPCPLTASDGTSCPHEFRHEQLVSRIGLIPPRELIECPIHIADLDVRQLLQGIEPPDQQRSERLAQSVAAIVLRQTEQMSLQAQQTKQFNRDVLERLDEIKIKQDAIAAEQQRTFLASLRLQQSWQAVQCPSVVTMEHVRRRAGGLLGSVVRLHLYCEAPGQWHHLPDAVPYEVKLTPETAATVLPYAQKILSVLKYVVPVAGASIGIASEDLAKHLKGAVETMEALVAGLPEELADRGTLDGIRSMIRTASGAEFRAMHQLLSTLDPKQIWGGLTKVPTPEGHVYWLCTIHADQYRGLPGELPQR
ncbi:hypothetical protein [Streptacidiphilus jeojiensis]